MTRMNTALSYEASKFTFYILKETTLSTNNTGMFRSSFRNMLWCSRTQESVESKWVKVEFSLCFMSVLPHHSMFLKLNRKTSNSVLYFLENSFQNINNWIDIFSRNKLSTKIFTYFYDVIHDFYPDLENGSRPIRVHILLNLLSNHDYLFFPYNPLNKIYIA